MKRYYIPPVRYSYLKTFADANADIFAASLLISYYMFSFLISSSIVIISFYFLSKRFFLKREGLSDARVASVTKKEYDFAAYFSQRFKKSLKWISDEWLDRICWSSRLLGIFIIKYCAEFSLKYFGRVK